MVTASSTIWRICCGGICCWCLSLIHILRASRVNWIAGAPPEAPVRCTAKARYSQQVDAPCTVYPLEGRAIRVVFDQPQRAVTAGQAVVLYNGDEVLGGGTIESTE